MASRLQHTVNKASALLSSAHRFSLPSVVLRPHSGQRRSIIAMAGPTTVAPEEVGQAANRTGQEAKQHTQPGQEAAMKVKPQWIHPDYKGSDKLKGKVALITGGDSGIGRAVAVHYAREGAAAIVSVYKGGHEDEDAEETKRLVEAEGSKCLNIVADIGDPKACKDVIARTVKEFGQLDILVNNAAEQHVKEDVREIAPEQLQKTFATNIFSMFYLSQEAVNHLKPGSAIINTTSVLGFKGKPVLLDYAATKGAIVAFTKSLSNQLVEKGIRVNGVAPGPVWAPLIPATMGEEVAKVFGQETPMKRMGQPSECAPSFVFLASNLDSSYISGQVLHPNGGVVVN